MRIPAKLALHVLFVTWCRVDHKVIHEHVVARVLGTGLLAPTFGYLIDLKVVHLDLFRMVYIDRLMVSRSSLVLSLVEEMINRRQLVLRRFNIDRLHAVKIDSFRALLEGFYVAEEIEIFRFDLIIVFEYLGSLLVATDLLESVLREISAHVAILILGIVIN